MEQTKTEHLHHPVPPRTRPKVTEGRTERVETPRGPIYVTINEDEMGMCEVFVKSLDAEAEVIGRLGSLLLRAGVDPREIIEQMWRVRTREMAMDKSIAGITVTITTVSQGIALAMGRYLYGDGFNPQKDYPKASTLPEPLKRNGHQMNLKFQSEPRASEPAELNVIEPVDEFAHFVGICQDCGEKLSFEGGCVVCKHCGYSRCG